MFFLQVSTNFMNKVWVLCLLKHLCLVMLSDSALIWFLSRCICVKLNRSISSQDHNFDIYTSKVSFIKKINNKSSSLKIGPLGEGGGGGRGGRGESLCYGVLSMSWNNNHNFFTWELFFSCWSSALTDYGVHETIERNKCLYYRRHIHPVQNIGSGKKPYRRC